MTTVVVAGAGLAGLTVAKLLAERGFSVTVLEAGRSAGGKSAGWNSGGAWREHGYHIFPPWYENTRAVLRDLGVTLTDFDRWHYLTEAAPDAPVTVPVPHSLSTLYQAFQAELLPWNEFLLYLYLAVDTLGEPLSHAALLDQISRLGQMRSRWYVTDRMPEFEQESLVTASAIRATDMSAMTAKIVVSYWARALHPFLSILPDNIQTCFINPYLAATQAAGAVVKLEEPVVSMATAGGRITELVTQKTDGTVTHYPADAFVMTTPLEVTRSLIGADVQALDPDLGNFEHLEAAPMAALQMDLDRKLTWTPREHVVLKGSRYGLSFIDLSHHWPGMTESSLSFISSNFMPLRDFTRDQQYAALMGEITKFTSVTPAMVVRYSMIANTNDPLFLNTVGAWENRPGPKASKVPNLYFAGDWVKNHVDLASMEGAICSAMEAARVLAEDYGVFGVPRPRRAKTYPEWMFRGLKWALAPGVLPLWLYTKAKALVA